MNLVVGSIKTLHSYLCFLTVKHILNLRNSLLIRGAFSVRAALKLHQLAVRLSSPFQLFGQMSTEKTESISAPPRVSQMLKV